MKVLEVACVWPGMEIMWFRKEVIMGISLMWTF